MTESVHEAVFVATMVVSVVAVAVEEVAEEGGGSVGGRGGLEGVHGIGERVVRQKGFAPNSTDGVFTRGQQHVRYAPSVIVRA